MTQEEKKLLLRVMCSMLMYGVKVNFKLPNYTKKTFEEHIGYLETIDKYGGYKIKSKGIDYRGFGLDFVPYLRPMSSMTDEERKEYYAFFFSKDDEEFPDTIEEDEMFNLIDWLNEHHLDYLGLIEKVLALEAPDGMYDTIAKA